MVTHEGSEPLGSVPRDVHNADLVLNPGLEAGGDLRHQQDVGRLEGTEPGDVPVRRLHILRGKFMNHDKINVFISQVVNRKDRWLVKYQNKSEYLVEYIAGDVLGHLTCLGVETIRIQVVASGSLCCDCIAYLVVRHVTPKDCHK